MKKFGEFFFDSERQRLRHANTNKEVEIDHKLFELLSLFIEKPNTIVSRQYILDHLWSGSIVTDNAINKLIANLRKVLGDDAKTSRYIQTVPKRGYRFICEVSSIDNSAIENSEPLANTEAITSNNSAQRKHVWPLQKYVGVAISVFLLLFFGFYVWEAESNKYDGTTSHTIALTRTSGLAFSAQMHPDNVHLFYLKKNSNSAKHELWIKNIQTSVVTKADIINANVSHIIGVTDNVTHSINLLYLDKNQDKCSVSQASFSLPKYVLQSNESLFDCSKKRIKDIDFNPKQQTIYYTAQPKNFWPNHVYGFHLSTKKHTLITQTEPTGWGHHNIDVSPDGDKLMIMSTDSDYKTQILSLNLLTNKIIEGVKFDQPVFEAIWHHDSQRIIYFSTAPSQQIMVSGFNGENLEAVVSVTEQLSANMSLFSDGKNILFSTEKKNYSNRWLSPLNGMTDIDNSSVSDIYPALFHHSDKFLFISNRSGQRQLYMAEFGGEQANIVTNFSKPHWLAYIEISSDDKRVLLNVDNKVYQVPIDELNHLQPLTSLTNEHLIYTSQTPIISLDWLPNSKVAVTAVAHGVPELVVIETAEHNNEKQQSRWAYGLTDSENPEHVYFIEKLTNSVFRTHSESLEGSLVSQDNRFEDTNITLPNEFYHVKIDDDRLYYVTTEQGKECLNSVSLNQRANKIQHPLNDFSSYDVSNERILISDLESLEGNIHRTVL